MFQVGIVHQAPQPFVPAEGPVKIQGHIQQGLHGRGGEPQLGHQLFRRGIQQRLQIAHGFFAGVPPAFQQLGELRIGRIAQGLQLFKLDGQAVPGPVPADVQAAAQLPQLRRRLGEAVHIGSADLLLPGHQAQQPVHLPAPVFGGGPGLGHDLPAPGGIGRIGRGAAQLLHLLPRPLLRPGVALHPQVQVQNQGCQPVVGAAGAHGVRQVQETGVVLRPGIALLQHPFQGGGLHGLGPFVVHDLEVRAQAQNVAVLLQEGGAEAVDGAALGPAAEGILPPEPPVARVFGQALRQLLHNPALQLSGGRPGEGDDQETVQIHRVSLVTDAAHEPLGQHPGFAAAGAGGHQHRAATGFDGGGLSGCGFKFRHCLRLLPSGPRPSPGRAWAYSGRPRPPARRQSGRRRNSRS